MTSIDWQVHNSINISTQEKLLKLTRFLAGFLAFVIVSGIGMSAYADKINDPSELAVSQGITIHNNGVIEVRVFEGIGNSFLFPPDLHQQALFGVGVFNDGLVTTAAGVSFEWINIISPNVLTINNPPAEQVSQSVYNDGAVEISQTVTTLGGNQYAVWNLEAENISGSTINDFRIGISEDWDVDDTPEDDQAAYDNVNDLAYQFETTYVGISSPTHSSTHDLRLCCDPEDAILNPNNLNSLDVDDETANLNWNFGSLAPGQSVSLDVIVAAGSSLADLQNVVQEAKSALNPVVGGELLPIDTTALLLAGVQTPMAWMIYAFSAIGIGAFLFTRNPNNIRNVKVILQDYLDRL